MHTSVTWECGKRGVHGVTSGWEIILGHRVGHKLAVQEALVEREGANSLYRSYTCIIIGSALFFAGRTCTTTGKRPIYAYITSGICGTYPNPNCHPVSEVNVNLILGRGAQLCTIRGLFAEILTSDIKSPRDHVSGLHPVLRCTLARSGSQLGPIVC